jgi:alpha-ribazole phosphatase
MTELILIRHGQTDWNVEGRYQGQADVPLNRQGLEQARKVAAALAQEKIDAIYSSDLARARQTAEIIQQATGAPLHIEPRLREISQGLWEGMLFSEIKARDPQRHARRKVDPLNTAPPGGETVGQVRQRVLAAVREILRRHPEQRVALVSHGLALAILITEARGLPIEQVWDLIPDNAKPVHLELEAL